MIPAAFLSAIVDSANRGGTNQRNRDFTDAALAIELQHVKHPLTILAHSVFVVCRVLTRTIEVEHVRNIAEAGKKDREPPNLDNR